MPSYWIVVRRENEELFDALSQAFRTRSGFDVIVDRRGGAAPRRRGVHERRGTHARWDSEGFIVVERLEPIH